MSPERLPQDFHLAAGWGPPRGCGGGLEGASRPPTDANLNSLSQEYLYEDLLDATGGFSSASLLGVGTYGSVYQGTLRDGTEVAVKTLSRPNESGFREEVEVLSRFRHPNLVILMGFARHAEERYLVYELLPGGDVCARLQKDASFTWRPRLSVILDAALGLSHLHGSRPQVFHRDVKTQNILMDRNGTGKMADFGLALLAKPECRAMQVENTSGTIGYADPLYIRTGRVTEASEVYSFGMVLLEILTGKPPALQHPDGRIEYQFSHLRGELAKVRAMLDPRGQWSPGVAGLVGSLALRCVHQQEALRPAFTEVVSDLRRWLREHHADGGTGSAKTGSAEPPPVAGCAAGVGSFADCLSPHPEAASGTARGPAAASAFRSPAWASCASGSIPTLPSRGSLSYPSAAPGRPPPSRRDSFPLHFDGGPNTDTGDNPGLRRVPLQLAGWGTSQSSSSGPPREGERARSSALDPVLDRGSLPESMIDPGLRHGEGVLGGSLPEGALNSGLGNGEGVLGGSPLVDSSPRACVDCGPPLSPALSALPPPATALSASHSAYGARSSWLLGSRHAVACAGATAANSLEEADVWIDPLPRHAGSGTASTSAGTASASSNRGDPLNSSILLRGAGVGRSLASTAGKAGEQPMPRPQSADKVSEEQRAIMQQLKAEMGFSEMQVSEAIKRCSTAEGAIDWILSPEREWNL